MPANTEPRFTLNDRLATGKTIATGNTTKDGTAGTTELCTMGANGGYLKKVVFRPLGTNVQTVARIFANNGNDPTVAANNALLGELRLPATTLIETDAQQGPEWVFNEPLPAGYRLYVSLGTTVAAGFQVVPIWGDY